MEEWEEIWAKRRKKAIQQGKIHSNRPLTEDDVEFHIRNHGFPPEAFYPKRIEVHAVRNFKEHFSPPTDPSNGTAGRVKRYFLKDEWDL